MLPSLTNRLKVYLAPDHVSAAFFPRGSKQKKEITPLSQPCDLSTGKEPIWLPALHVLKELLAQHHEAGLDITIYIANAFCRFQCVGPQAGLGSYAEEEAYARFAFKETFGKDVDKWAVKCSGGVGLEAQVAIAIDQALLSQLEALIQAGNHKLISIQPYWIGAMNLLRKEILPGYQWIGVVESDRLVLASIHQGKWQSIGSYRLSANWGDALLDIVVREIQIRSQEPIIKMLLVIPQHIATTSLKELGWEVKTLTLTGENLLSGQYFPSAVVGVA